MDVIAVAVILLVVGLFVFRTENVSVDTTKIPDAISTKLLFTPYIPSKLPEGFAVDKDSFRVQETALIFTASNQSGGRLVVSEQSVPKDLSMDAFYSSTITGPQRLEGLKYRTIFGELQAKNGTLVSIVTTDNTWILVAMPKDATRETATIISQGLVQQQ